MKRVIGLIMIACLISGSALAADEWLKTRPQSTDQRINWPTASQANNAALDRVLGNFREGMRLTYSSASTIVVDAGEIVCSDATSAVRKMRQNTSSTNVTFSDIDTGAEASGTTYYVFANCDADATTATFKISASSTTPSGVTHYKRLGSFYNDSSSNITRINNDNELETGEWESKTVAATYQATNDGTIVFFGDSSSVRGQHMYCYVDGFTPPTTLRARYGSGSDQGSGTTLTLPVKAGDYYKCTWSATDAGSATMYFVSNN